MSKVTELATAQLSATDTLVIELVEANETPAAVIIRWPSKASVLHPHRSPLLLMCSHAPLPLPSWRWLRFVGTGSDDPTRGHR